MIIQAGDLNVELDTGTNEPSSVLQRLEDGQWVNYLLDGKPVLYPADIRVLTPGKYRLQDN